MVSPLATVTGRLPDPQIAPTDDSSRLVSLLIERMQEEPDPEVKTQIMEQIQRIQGTQQPQKLGGGGQPKKPFGPLSAGYRAVKFDPSVTDPEEFALSRSTVRDIGDALLTASDFQGLGLGSLAKVAAGKLAGLGALGVIKDQGLRRVPKYVESFHGTKTPEGIVKTDKLLPGGGDLGIQSGNAYGNGVYSSSLPSTASNKAYVGNNGAVLPLKIDVSNHLDLGNLTKDDYIKLNKLAESLLLPSDKSMLSPRNVSVTVSDREEALDFFKNQLANWKHFGGGIERAKPKAEQVKDGFKIDYTDYDAPISAIDSQQGAEQLLKTLGWDNVANMGYSGHILPRGGGEVWHITNDPMTIRSRFAKFDPASVDKVGLGLAEGGLASITRR